MHDATFPHPQTRGSVAAVVVLVSTLSALVLAALVTVVPVQLGGVALLALLLAVVGMVAGAYLEGGVR